VQQTPEDEEAQYRRQFIDPRVPAKQGVNTFQFSPRYADAATFRNIVMWGARTQGPSIFPGNYTVRLTVGGQTQTQPLRVLRNPNSHLTDAEAEEKLAFVFTVRDRMTDANNAVRTVRNVRWQVSDRVKQVPAADRANVEAIARTLADSMRAVEMAIYQVNNKSGQDPLKYQSKLNNDIGGLMSVTGQDGPVGAPAKELFGTLSSRLDVQLVRLRKVFDTQLSALNAELKRLGLPLIVPSTQEAPPEIKKLIS
jgi:hypothetical protein